MRSMTGYGKGIAEQDERKATVELKSVNHRFLDILFKLPRGFQSFEEEMRRLMSLELKRGHVDVYLTYEDLRAEKDEVIVDMKLAETYLVAAKKLEAVGVVNDLGVASLLKMPDVVSVTQKGDDEDVRAEIVKKATAEAVKNIVAMREREGAALKDDLLKKVAELSSLTDEVVKRMPEVKAEYHVKLEARVREALLGAELDENKLINEIAFFVDKSNVDEETVRLKGHIDHFREILNSDGIVGKQLDFLIQEMNREVNTTGSKAQDLALTECVLKMKNVVEMLREQIQNLE